jgi:prephenate dehydrogenase
MERITIIGLGLIGGSLALALKRAELGDVEIAGCARTRETLRKAKSAGAIDVAEGYPADAVRGARLVIIATPITAMRETFEEIAPALGEGAIVTDVASTKGEVARWAAELLPRNVHFIGGHPMAGKEHAGFNAADADLFRGRPWVVAPSVSASEAAVQTVIGIAQLVGARTLLMDPLEHDSYVAAISHLPLVLSAVLFSTAFSSAAWPEIAQLASTGFRDATRLASGPPEMAEGIMATNRDNVLHWMDRFDQELDRFRELIRNGDAAAVLEAFEHVRAERDIFMQRGAPTRSIEAPRQGLPGFADVILGSKIADAMRRSEQIIRDMESREKRR